MTEQQFIPKAYIKTVESGKVAWESPSNIALVKYWGKKKDQIPENPSISFTLNNCKTITNLTFSKKEDESDFEFEVYLDGDKKDDFKPKIDTFFKRVEVYLPFLKDYRFKIETSNTFPHSSGIASSASGMSALALCLISIEKQFSAEMTDAFFNEKASFLARLGSGSACRSIEGDLIVWGQTEAVEGSNDLFGVKYPYKVHENFKDYQDTILLVDKGEKQVSSTVGHNLMHNHPYAKNRFVQAHDNLEKLKPILESGDLKSFIALIESEALTLHAMMMTSMPYFILMKPNTLEIINKILKFREETGLHISFTLDAGANVHVLYPKNESVEILEFIKNELVAYCQNGHYICDQIGFGAQLIKN
ncbi:diphosphomevalonate/mevalonate 3,5-bisphosphate decarboxylase family protein [Mariniflexile sp. AS56]|uniref:diphosphomevalonate/mevalonate 3,5-bisphosphate decarboxylase family protein n=1 Tax=Mariniflexile sp. AS56 TaxID=3063957 RepID=UPI0026ECC213|nr:diphosphomevalonate decarboxylase [Mariniflexile sp. AS56]MDO7170853.1 diphosphomevalonate decarboxylase [Mariniflexile sp. AS56]